MRIASETQNGMNDGEGIKGEEDGCLPLLFFCKIIGFFVVSPCNLTQYMV